MYGSLNTNVQKDCVEVVEEHIKDFVFIFKKKLVKKYCNPMPKQDIKRYNFCFIKCMVLSKTLKQEYNGDKGVLLKIFLPRHKEVNQDDDLFKTKYKGNNVSFHDIDDNIFSIFLVVP